MRTRNITMTQCAMKIENIEKQELILNEQKKKNNERKLQNASAYADGDNDDRRAEIEKEIYLYANIMNVS